MSLAGKMIGFGLRQVIGDVAGNATETVVKLVVKRFADNSQTLPKALARANDRSWQALGIALAGDGLLDQIKVFFLASGDDKGIREQVHVADQLHQERVSRPAATNEISGAVRELESLAGWCESMAPAKYDDSATSLAS